MARQIVFQEIPDQISLSYLISGCELQCPGCHSADTWNQKQGQKLSLETLQQDIKQYREWITCVLFMGGEWHQPELCAYLSHIRANGFKTALYTGLEQLPEELTEQLDYIKYGRYDKNLGGLDSATTNQYLVEVKTGKVLKGNTTTGGQHDSVK